MKKKLIFLYGGKSPEHEVSLETAFSVINALDLNKFDTFPIYITYEGIWIQGPKLTDKLTFSEQLRFKSGKERKFATSDQEVSVGELISPAGISFESENTVVFPLLHGPNGEDGTIQGLLEVLNIPYVGNGVLASAAAMDKIIMKKVFADAGIPQVPAVSVRAFDWKEHREEMAQDIEGLLTYPIFVKPANLGSSVGISKATDNRELKTAIDEAFRFDRRVIVEQGVDAREIEIAVLGNDTPICSVPGEILPKGHEEAFYDYKAKYEDNSTILIIPAELEEGVLEQIKEYAIQAFLGLDGSGLARADFFVTKNNEIFLNEVNTMPGFTPISMYPMLFEASGMPYNQLIEQLIELGLERYEAKNHLQHQFKD
ncbi:D-alanine--D-alanine ligase [Listeria sp. PSOL-1]|uniref:D-alanine--D-alanine ligase n=1 Tax=Listeria sp. PSOL-1 TaxID=1844999 RepID=UPI0013D88D00|nr:D-alanine--D-alanine ligase [Listeria sp. PSOL-1]